MSRLARHPFKDRDRDWSRTPAAMFACAVLGLASVSGLAWSWNRALRQAGNEPAPGPYAVQRSDAGMAAAGKPVPRPNPRPDAVKRIDVNTADLAELDLLPGVGPAIGQRIIDDRAANGPYESVDDLQRVSGIGPRTIEKIRPLAVVGRGSDEHAPAPTTPGG